MSEEDISLESLMIAAGVWLLEHRDKSVGDMDDEFICLLSLRLQKELAALHGELH